MHGLAVLLLQAGWEGDLEAGFCSYPGFEGDEGFARGWVPLTDIGGQQHWFCCKEKRRYA